MAAMIRSIRWQAAGLVMAMAALLTGALLLEGRLDRSVTALIRGTALARMQAAAAGQVLSAMQDAETGQRGYLLTMRDYYLEPYQQAEAQLGALLDRLDGLARGTPWLQDEAAQLHALVDAKTAELNRTVALAREGGRDAAMPTVLTDAGKTATDGIRRSVDRISLRAEAERAQLADRCKPASAPAPTPSRPPSCWASCCWAWPRCCCCGTAPACWTPNAANA